MNCITMSTKAFLKFIWFVAGLLASFGWGVTGCSTISRVNPGNTTTLTLEVDDAASVDFVCSLDQFKSRAMRRVDNARWSIRVPDNHYFTYYYMVDGKIHVPDCRLKETDDFGSVNCIFEPALLMED